MDKTYIKITLSDQSTISVQKGTKIIDIAKEYQSRRSSVIICAKVDNDIKELGYKLVRDCSLEFIDLTNEDGMRMYRRTLHFILIKAVHDLFPDRKVVIGHSISSGIYCEILGDKPLESDEVTLIEKRMHELVDMEIPFVKKEVPIKEAREILTKYGRIDRLNAVLYRKKEKVTLYSCGDLEDYFYGYMPPHTGYVKIFELKFYSTGLILRYPNTMSPEKIPEYKEQKKLSTIFREYKRWNHVLGIENVGLLNEVVSQGKAGELIRVSEALQEKKVAEIADMIANSTEKKKIVLIAGPSSSGKTTFANRLAIQLRVNGIRPVTISMDDYFLDREQTPKDESGELDFEAIEALDIELFNKNLADLISFNEVTIPVYNFPKGVREKFGRKLKILENEVIVIEGIHGLNERLTSLIPHENKFKIYVSALTSLNIDDHNRIPTTDTRILRRIVRDYQFRGCSAEDTIQRWPSVRRGEEKNIFPFQEEADVMFNSSLMYELGALKTLAEPLLVKIDRSKPQYSEAKRLIEFLSYILPINPVDVPANSILREFLGGSCFYT